MATQPFKLIRKSTEPSNPAVGTLWFDSSVRAIKVYTAGGWEVYAGIMDAAIVEENLVLTKADGTKVTVDFNDCASAEALAALTTKVGTIEGNVNTNTSDITGLKTTVGEHTTALSTVDSRIEAAVKEEADRAKGIEGGLADRVGALETDNTTNKGDIATLKTAVNETIPGQIAALEGADEALQGRVKANEDKLAGVTVVKTYVDEAIAGVNQAINTEATTARAAEQANANAIAVEKGRVDTLVGADADKSVRTIATEVLAAELVPEGAAESLDTLQEIAAWIQEHPGDASEMNQKIGAVETLAGQNKTAIEGIQAAYVKSVVDSADYLEVTTAEGVVTVADATLKAKIQEMDAAIQANADNITEVNNKAGVTSFQGATGAVTVDTEAAANGAVKFAMANNKLSGTVTGLQDAAYATVASINATAQGYATTAESNAKSHAESKASEAQSAAVTSANSYTDTKVAEAFVWAEFE